MFPVKNRTSEDGKIAYAGKQGPWGFKPKEVERALRRLLRRQEHNRKNAHVQNSLGVILREKSPGTFAQRPIGVRPDSAGLQ